MRAEKDVIEKLTDKQNERYTYYVNRDTNDYIIVVYTKSCLSKWLVKVCAV